MSGHFSRYSSSYNSQPSVTSTRYIKPFITRCLNLSDCVDFHKYKVIKRLMAMTEKQEFKNSLFQQNRISSAHIYPKKQAQDLRIGLQIPINRINALSRVLKKQSNLKRLSLSFSDAQDKEGWVKLGKLLCHLSRVRKLFLCFEQDSRKTEDKILKKLYCYVKRLPKAPDVTVKYKLFYSTFSFSLNLLAAGFSFNQGLFSTKKSWSKEPPTFQGRLLSQIRAIKLDNRAQIGVGPNALWMLKTMFGKLPKLSKVDLTFNRGTFTSSKQISQFLDSLAYASNLKFVRFRISVSKNITNLSLIHPIWKKKTIKRLSLKFEFALDSHYKTLSQTLQLLPEVPSIHKLSLDFSYCKNMDDELLGVIEEVILKIRGLKKFSLFLVGCTQITNFEISHLISSIIKLKGLEILHLDFTGCKISSSYNSKYEKKWCELYRLSKMNLSLNKCTGLNEGSLNAIVDMIGNSKQLESLNLDVEKCSGLNTRVLERLNKGLLRLRKLETLALKFGDDSNPGKENINEDAVWSYQKAMIKERSSILQDEEICRLGECISQLKSLKNVSLDVKASKYITGKGFMEFCKEFYKLYNIRKFNLVGNLNDEPMGLWEKVCKLPQADLIKMVFDNSVMMVKRPDKGI